MKAWAEARSGIFVSIDAEQGNALKEIQTESLDSALRRNNVPTPIRGALP